MIERIPEAFSLPDVSENNILAELARLQINSHGEPLTWGATPLASSIDLKMQQDAVKSVIASFFDKEHTPSFVSVSLSEYIETLNMSRTVNRESKNQDSFVYRGKTNLDGIPLEVLEMFDRAIRGYASPAELLFVQNVLEVPTIELASLTHPYGQRIELLKEMRTAVNQAIELRGGELVRGITPEYKVKGSDNLRHPESMEGIHMTRKTIFGYLADGTKIIERSSFVVLIDRLPSQQAQAIRNIPYGPDWATRVCKIGKLEELVPVFLKNDEYDKAIPVSTTTVAVNESLENRLLTQEAMRARQRRYLAEHASKI